MGKSSNSGNLLNPKNLVPAILTGGVSYGLSELSRNMKPPAMPNTPGAPMLSPGAIPTPGQPNAVEALQERQNRLKQMQFGFASTITSKNGNSTGTPSSILVPSAQPLKTKTGQ